MFSALRRQHGSAAAEFAILLPIFVVILFGIISFGIALVRLVTYVGAAREGARYAAVHCEPQYSSCVSPDAPSDAIYQRVLSSANGFPVDQKAFTVSTNCALTPGDPVVVSWTQPIMLQVPLLPDMSFTKTISGSFRCE
jgi:hypothetical protein